MTDIDRVAATRRARQRIADAYYGGVPEAVPMWLVSATLDAIDYDSLVEVVEAAKKGYARSQCGSCDAGLPMNCTCNPMDSALADLDRLQTTIVWWK